MYKKNAYADSPINFKDALPLFTTVRCEDESIIELMLLEIKCHGFFSEKKRKAI